VQKTQESYPFQWLSYNTCQGYVDFTAQWLLFAALPLNYVTSGAFKPTGYTACLFALTAVKHTASTSVASAFADNASVACAHGKGAPNTNTYTFSHIIQASMVAEAATNQHMSLRRLHITLFLCS
jgi:hypothetical protein